MTSGARCCGRVASIAARRKPVGGDGVAEVVALQTQTWYWPDQIVLLSLQYASDLADPEHRYDERQWS